MARSILALVLVALLLMGFGCSASEESRNVIQASEILAKIEHGKPVEYDGVIIEGDLDLNELDLPMEQVERKEFERTEFERIEIEIEYLGLDEDAKLVTSPIIITNSKIRGALTFSNTIFQESVDFTGTNFSGDANFGGALFKGDADFWWVQFSRYANFYWAQFESDALFYRAQFSGYADFQGTQFSSYANFGSAQFSGWANFGSAQFEGTAHFHGAQFESDVDFLSVQFNGDVEFKNAQFKGDTNFTDAKFSDNRNSKMNFGETLFDGNATFVDTQFSQYADFRKARFSNSLNLTHARFDRLELRWSSIENHLNCDDTAYMALIKNYENLAWFEDADECLYAYRNWRRKNSEFGITKLLDYAALVSCGYGVKPRRPLILGLFLVVICAGYYRRTKAIKRHEKEGNHQEANIWDAFYFSMMTFTTVGYGDWYPLDKHRKLVMVEGIVGWLTLSLFLVTLANVVIR